jgi:hypothetical protein
MFGFGIHEKGTNFFTSVFCPDGYVQADFYNAAEKLAPVEKKRKPR